jgi:hypothetical protein
MRNGKNMAICLAAERKNVGNMIAEYKLYLLRCHGGRRYEIRISYGGEAKACTFGKKYKHARRAFKMICRGLVTPCTLEYLAMDMAEEQCVLR